MANLRNAVTRAISVTCLYPTLAVEWLKNYLGWKHKTGLSRLDDEDNPVETVIEPSGMNIELSASGTKSTAAGLEGFQIAGDSSHIVLEVSNDEFFEYSQRLLTDGATRTFAEERFSPRQQEDSYQWRMFLIPGGFYIKLIAPVVKVKEVLPDPPAVIVIPDETRAAIQKISAVIACHREPVAASNGKN